MRDLDEPSPPLEVMSRRRVTTIAILLIVVSIGPLAQASDADGDGVDDSNDAFPNDPCASLDYDRMACLMMSKQGAPDLG